MGAPGLPGSQFPSEDAQIRRLKDLERQVQQFAAANVLATAGISTAAGGLIVDGFMEFRREDDTVGVRVDPVTGTFTAYDATGTAEVARFGALIETAELGALTVEPPDDEEPPDDTLRSPPKDEDDSEATRTSRALISRLIGARSCPAITRPGTVFPPPPP